MDTPLESEILNTIQRLETGMATQPVDGEAKTTRLTPENLPTILSPAKRLPPELLCDIFRHSLSDGYVSGSRRSRPPWTLGHICHSWRITALAYPFLWSFITLFWSPLKLDCVAPALKSQLSRTNNAPLSVFMRTGPNPTITQELFSLLIPTAPRWRLFQFHGMTQDRLHFITELQGHMQSLERLEFTHSGGVEIPDIFSQNVPRLRIIDLFKPDFVAYSPHVQVPLSQLTHYRATWGAETHAANLTGAHNLQVCVLGIIEPLAELPPVHLPRLRALHLESLEFLLCVTAPALEHLAVFSNSEGDDIETLENVLPFLQRSGCAQKLRRLAIMECEMPGSDVVDLLRAVVSLEAHVLEFSIEGADPSAILEALTIGDEERIVCPKLTSLTYGYDGEDKPMECINMLPALARSRARFLSLQSRSFKLCIYWCGSKLAIVPEYFQDLAKEGVDLVWMPSTDPRVVSERWGDF
ncbi:hypothetical protein C8F01DRAFT_1245299 [Mycena amicta]|nr:hypothetical protein C8F01DRAFT_1245299 [Mycena amicta]